jgi:hypothetical protein
LAAELVATQAAFLFVFKHFGSERHHS